MSGSISGSVAAGFNTSNLGRNDDNFSNAIPLGFTLNFYGTSYSTAFVSNNGYITFGAGQGSFTPTGLGAGYSGNPIIAAFYADVDTRGTTSGITSYGTGTYAGHTAFGVTWPGVGYYSGHTDKLDTFQLILVDRSDTGSGNFDIYLNYGSIQWETGDASGGSGGLGGTSAAVGFNAGVGNASGTFFQEPGSLAPGSFLNGGPDALSTTTNDGVPGQLMFQVRGGRVGGGTVYSIAPSDATKPDGLSGTTPYTFVVSRTGDTSAAATVGYAVAGSGANPADSVLFSGVNGSVQFAAGDASETVTITVSGAAVTADEGFTVTISAPGGATVATAAASGTIQQNYTPATLPSAFLIPGASGSGTLTATSSGTAPAAAAPVPTVPSESDVIRISSTAVGVDRFFDRSNGTHFFTGSASEANAIASGAPGLRSEGVAFLALDPAAAASDPNAIAVYRFFDAADGSHFFTASASERATVTATRPDLVYEGIGFYEHATPQAGDTAVYRFFDSTTGTHFYTADANERASILATRTDLRPEGIGFYAPSNTVTT